MLNKTGIWIDQKKAVIVNYNEKNEEQFYRIESGFEGKERTDGEGKEKNTTRMGTHFNIDEKGLENRHKEILRKFYLEIILRINDGAEVYIFGPAAAKDELAAKIRSYESLNILIQKLDNADSMTDNQVAAKIRRFFHVDHVAA